MQAGRWDHTAAITATTLNVHRGKKQPIHVVKLNPYRKNKSASVKLPKEHARQILFSILGGNGKHQST